MSSTTVAEFASELKKSTETLLDQLKSAGVPKASASDALTDGDKQKLLSFLQASHGTATADRKKITLVKKSTSEIKQADATGRKPLDVELRLLQRVPERYRVGAHHWLILHGRYVCTARGPKCGECAVSAYCDSRPR